MEKNYKRGMKMMDLGIIAISGVCAIVLVIGIMGRKAEIIVNFVLRAVFGLISIYFLNELISLTGIGIHIGLNPFNAAACGFLGFPGVALLYGVKLVSLLG